MIQGAFILAGLAIVGLCGVLGVYIRSSHLLEAQRDLRKFELDKMETEAASARIVAEANRPVRDSYDIEVARLEYHTKQCELAEKALSNMRWLSGLEEIDKEKVEALMDALTRQLSAEGPIGAARERPGMYDANNMALLR